MFCFILTYVGDVINNNSGINVLESGSSASIEGSIRDAPTELLQQICYHLQSKTFRKSVGILPEQRDQFFQALKRGLEIILDYYSGFILNNVMNRFQFLLSLLYV